MESNTSPVNIPSDKQPRRPSNFLSLSPSENPASPPKSATIPEKEAAKSSSPTLSPVATSPVTAPADLVNESRRSSSASRASASDNGFRFLKLGHAKPGDGLGDWVE